MDSRDQQRDEAAETPVAESGHGSLARWMKTWLACLAFYYPTLWFGISCISAGPALLRVALLGDRLVFLRLTALGVMARSVPSHPSVRPYRAHFAPSPWMLIPLLAVIAAVLAAAGRKNRVLSGLAIAVLADAALMLPMAHFAARRGAGLSIILTSLFFFVSLCFGLDGMLAGWKQPRYWLRAGSLIAAAALPPLPLWVLLRFSHSFYFRLELPALMAPAALAALLISFRAPGESRPEPHPADWRQPLVGILATVLVIVIVTTAGPALTRAIDQRQMDANRTAMASLPPIPTDAAYPKVFFQKGVSFSAEFPDPYASAGARQMLRSLQKYGVNAVALIPYGSMQLGSTEIHSFGRNSWESEEGMSELSRLAHSLGIKVMLKPGMWVRGGHFAGDVAFASQAERDKWFDEYSDFIVRYAEFATQIHADLFCVGGEFVQLTPDASEWRKIIARVRKVYPGPLTYGANFGGEFEKLSFWDAVDYIGLQEYYPLPDNLSTGALVQKVEAVQKRFPKPVIFTEAGFPSMVGANLHPWEDGASGKVALGLQARCYTAIFRAFYDKPWFKGMYWWKVGTNGFGGPQDTSLTPWDKPAMAVIKKWYVNDGR